MHLPSGVELAGFAILLTAVPAVVALVNKRVLALGAAIAAAASMAGVIAAALTDLPVPRMSLGSTVAIGAGVGTLILLAGTALLPGAAESPGAAVRHLLDGLVIAAAIWFVGWVLLSAPTRILGDSTPMACPSLLVPAAIACVSLGLTAALALHAHRPRLITVRVAAGVSVVAVGSTALAGGLCQGWDAAVLAGSVLVPAGLFAIARAVRTADRPVRVDGDAAERGTAYAVVPMSAMVTALGFHVYAGGAFGLFGFLGAAVEGFALVFRQSLALHDVRGFAVRLRQSEAHYRELAHTDPLTSLANRRGLQRALREHAHAPVVLVGIDLDGFKTVNDVRGHDAGDAVLCEVGVRLRRNLLADDVAARLGGDEFAVLMHGTVDEAMLTAHRLLAVLGEPFEVDGGSIFLSASIGVADGGELMHDADLALRYAKQRGKNRVERYQARYDELLRRRGTLESELRHAIDRDELRLVYQPVVALPSMRPVGAEALLRWHHPTLGAVRPDEFIPVAEESGLINRIGSWVLERATRQLADWLAQGHDVWVSVNLSPKELHAADYAGQVAELLAECGAPPQRLVLEVTEHAVATDMEELISRLAELRATGVRIALDDFGAGYSSLGQLRTLPVDILKIDHALVTDEAAPLVDVVVRLGHRLGLEVLAEGIGTPAQREAVEDAGCRLGQGSLFGWGVPAEHLEAQLRTLRTATRPAPVPRSAPPKEGTARSQVVKLGPGMRQLRALLPTDPAFEALAGDQNVGSIDSGSEMRHG
ncbi:bifunctional diguanylate cyclase/phosphodiesterase [Actinoplanes sp. TBRC 11911]|uniref:putative bifunctional diguanylate cyclase/phosphodiesterase n=1 Tax=Actinoplanes sp. TBRC 11911 TaxID=2729386 RepID=UPI002898FBE4|nr:bifunctional diguanylate cyclase/phosphodiesterase [Actinoplanes sp. TBRC 11911]